MKCVEAVLRHCRMITEETYISRNNGLMLNNGLATGVFFIESQAFKNGRVDQLSLRTIWGFTLLLINVVSICL